jgi:hypothetical protein
VRLVISITFHQLIKTTSQSHFDDSASLQSLSMQVSGRNKTVTAIYSVGKVLDPRLSRSAAILNRRYCRLLLSNSLLWETLFQKNFKNVWEITLAAATDRYAAVGQTVDSTAAAVNKNVHETSTTTSHRHVANNEVRVETSSFKGN